MRPLLLAFVFSLLPFANAFADLQKIERTIAKEPVYQTESPRYLLLAFGPTAKDRVWLVQDGSTIFVDRNGNGDLTEPGEKVIAEPSKDKNPDESQLAFKLGDIRVGGRLHRGLVLSLRPLQQYPAASRADIRAILRRDAKAMMATLRLDVESPKRKGGGLDGRVSYVAGPVDPTGVLQFIPTPATASVVHFDGPWQVSFYGDIPTLRIGRDSELILAVGTPGHGPGTFAMIEYTDTIPEDAFPAAELAYPASSPNAPPIRARLDLKQRC